MLHVSAVLRKPHDSRLRRADHQAAARLVADAVEDELDGIVAHVEAIKASLRRIRARIDSAAPWVDWPHDQRLRSVLLFLILPACAFGWGMADGKISGDDWNGLAAAFSGSAAMTIRRNDLPLAGPCSDKDEAIAELRARVVLLEAANGKLRAKLNDPRYLLRRGLALLSSHRGVTVGLAAAASTAFLIVAPGPFRLVSAWERLVLPAAASDHLHSHRRSAPSPSDIASIPGPVSEPYAIAYAWPPITPPSPVVADAEADETPKLEPQEVISESGTTDQGNQGDEAGAASAPPVQPGRHPLVGRPPVDRSNGRPGQGPAEAGQQRVSPTHVGVHARPVVPGVDGRADLQT